MAYQYKGKLKEPEPIVVPSQCGTDWGYHLHSRHKTAHCQPCKDAHAAAQRKWSRRPTMRTICGTYPGYMRHKRSGEDSCEYCLAGYAQYMRDYRERKKPFEKAARLFAAGASQREVQRVTGLTRETLREHFPGQGWTRQQGGEFTARMNALRRAS